MAQATTNPFTIILIVAAVFLLALISLAIWASTVRRQRSTSRQEALFALGFTPLNPPPAALLERIAALQQHRNEDQVTLHDVYERPITGGHAYLFDSVDAGSTAPSWLGAGTLAITSRALQCPTLVVLPRLQMPGPMGTLVETLAEKAYALAGERGGLARATFPDDPEFDERFVVMGEDVSAIEGFLTPQRRTALLALPVDLVVGAHHDTLTLSAYARAGDGETAIEQLQSRRELAEALLHAFAMRGSSLNV